MRYQIVVVQRLEKLLTDIQNLEYKIKRGYSIENTVDALKEFRDTIEETKELAERTQ